MPNGAEYNMKAISVIVICNFRYVNIFGFVEFLDFIQFLKHVLFEMLDDGQSPEIS
jgi:hypothetical protein